MDKQTLIEKINHIKETLNRLNNVYSHQVRKVPTHHKITIPTGCQTNY